MLQERPEPLKYPMSSAEAEALLDLFDASADASALAEVCWQQLDGRDLAEDEVTAKVRRLLWMLVSKLRDATETSVERLQTWKGRHDAANAAEIERAARTVRRRERRARRAQAGQSLTLVRQAVRS